MLTNKRFTNIPWKNWKPIPLAALFALLPPKKVGERGGLRTGRPKGVYQASGATHQLSRWAQTVLGPQRPAVLGTQGTCQLLPHTPPQQSHTHTHTHSCTLPWLTSHDTNDQPNYGYTHTTQSYSHAKRLHSQTSNLTVLSTKSHEFVFIVEEFQCTHTQDHCTPIISTAHETLGHHRTMCVCC